MVRSRAFDEGAVLTDAMHAFRRNGYAATAIPALEAATGISAGSIYNSYGDKRGIFFAAFEHYLKAVLEYRIARHAAPSHGLAGLRQLFLSLLREPGGEKFGCLITNSAIEFGPDKEMTDQTVRKGFEILERVFLDRMTTAKSAGKAPKRPRSEGGIDPVAGTLPRRTRADPRRLRARKNSARHHLRIRRHRKERR